MKQLYSYLFILLLSAASIKAQYATKSFGFLPAAGQFTNTQIGMKEDSANVLGNNSSLVSLGSFGGYAIVGFDKPVINNPYNPYGVEFTIKGNSFSGWSEPGAVQVMKDLNHNNIPDDGEWSTEVLNIGITAPDSSYVAQDYYKNYIGITQLQVVKGHTVKYDGLLFKNGIPQSEGTKKWWTSDTSVGTVDNDGNFTAAEPGTTWLHFSQQEDVAADSIKVQVVSLTGVVLEMEGNNSKVSSDTTSLLVGEKAYIIGQCTGSRTEILNATVANRFVYEPLVWTTSNPAVGTIENGLFTGTAPGATYVYAHSESQPELYDSIKVIVNKIPDVAPISSYMKISSASYSGSYASSALFATGTTSDQIILNSATAKRGNMDASISKNVFYYSFTQGKFATDTVRFSVKAFRKNYEFDIVFDYMPAVIQSPKQWVFDYTGTDSVNSIRAYIPDSVMTKTIAALSDETLSDMQSDGAYLFVATDKRLLRYNLSSYKLEASRTLAQPAGKILVYANRVYVTSSENGSGKLRVYYKTDLGSAFEIGLASPAVALTGLSSKIYALLNDGSSSSLAVVDAGLSGVSLEKTLDWGTDALNTYDMLAKGSKVFAIRRKSGSVPTAIISYNAGDDSRSVTELSSVEYQSASTPAVLPRMSGDTILLKNKHVDFTFKVTVAAKQTTRTGYTETSHTEIYPALTKGTVYVKLTRESDISVYNLWGAKVAFRKGTAGLNNLELGHLPQGIYFVKAANKITKVMLFKQKEVCPTMTNDTVVGCYPVLCHLLEWRRTG